MLFLNRVLHFIVLTLCSSSISVATPDCVVPIEDEAYYEVPRQRYKLTESQQATLDRLKDRLDGEWRGELTKTRCEGTISKPIKVMNTASVKLDIKPYPRWLTLKAKIDFRQQDKKVFIHERLFEDLDIRSLLHDDNNAFIISEKNYRQLHRQKTGTTLIETISKVLFKDDVLHFDIIRYQNGYFESEERWVLRVW